MDLSQLAGSKLNLVDPWLAQDSKLYLDISNVEQQDQDKRYGLVKARMEKEYPTRHAIFRTFSVDAAKSPHFAENSLDYIYVDARHDYAGVKEDIEAWWPKLKAGGVFAGHDFVPDGIIKQGDFGVQKALHEFARVWGVEVQTISEKSKSGGREESRWWLDHLVLHQINSHNRKDRRKNAQQQ